MSVDSEAGTLNGDGGLAASNAVYAPLKPGKTYVVSCSAYNQPAYYLRISGIDGFKVFIEDPTGKDINRSAIYSTNSGNGWQTANFKVRVESLEVMGPGECGSLQPERLAWSVGLGALKNGNSAGTLAIRDPRVLASSSTAAGLIFDSDKPEVDRIMANGVLRQVFSNQCLADILPETDHSYWIKFYAREQVSTFSGGLWTVTGTPFVAYHIEAPNSPATDKFRITRTWNSGGGSRTMWTEMRRTGTEADPVWTLIDWTATAVGVDGPSIQTWTYSNSKQTETIETKNNAGIVARRIRNNFSSIGNNTLLVSSIKGYGDTNPLQTSMTYYQSTSEPGNYGRVKTVLTASGNWSRFEYCNSGTQIGRISKVYKPLTDLCADPNLATTNNAQVTSYEYDWTDWTGMAILPTKIETTAPSNGSAVTISKTIFTYSYENESGTNEPLLVVTQKSYSSAQSFYTTIRKFYREDADPSQRYLPGLISSEQRADGTQTVHQYIRADVNWPFVTDFQYSSTGGLWADIQYHGTTVGGVAFSKIPNAVSSPWTPQASFKLVVGVSTAIARIYNIYGGMPMWEDSYIYTSSGWVRIGRVTIAASMGIYVQSKSKYAQSTLGNSAGFAIQTYEQFSRIGGLLTSHTSEEGVVTNYGYDDANRVNLETAVPKVSSGLPGAIYHIRKYDAAGRMIEDSKSADSSGAGEKLTFSWSYDTADRLFSSSEPGPNGALTNTYSFFVNGNPRTQRLTRPNTGTTVTDLYLDGTQKSVTGSAQVPSYRFLDINSDGTIEVTVAESNSKLGVGWRGERRDWLGRIVYQSSPTTSTGVNSVNYLKSAYNGAGQLESTQLFDGSKTVALAAATRYKYDSMGATQYAGVDIDESGSLETASSDRVAESKTYFSTENGAWWNVTERYSYTGANSSVKTLVKTIKVRLTEYPSYRISDSYEIDGDSNSTHFWTDVTYTDACVKESVLTPTSTTTAVTETRNGYRVAETSVTATSANYSYDTLGRVSRVSRRGDDITDYTYYNGSALVRYLRPKSLLFANWKEYSYDFAGRIFEEKVLHEDQTQRITRHGYDAMDHEIHTWGNSANPTESVFDSYGRLTLLRTFRGGGPWDTSVWPSAPGVSDETEFRYDDSTGLLRKKALPIDTTSLSYPSDVDFPGVHRGVIVFTYNLRNQISTRTWVRGVSTTYLYEDTAGFRTGELRGVDYSDATPDLVYSRKDSNGNYDRRGLVRSITDACGTRSFDYRNVDTRATSEDLDPSFYGNDPVLGKKRINYNYNGVVPGRFNGHSLGYTISNSIVENEVFSFDGATGRISSITAGGGTWTYGYLDNSDYVNSLTNGSFSKTISYQYGRDLIDFVQTKWNSTNVSNFVYDYNWLGERTSVKTTGALAVQLGWGVNGLKQSFLYNTRSELEYSNGKLLDSAGNANGSDETDQYRDLDFDNAGNRTSEYRIGTSRAYSVNSLNQYTSNSGFRRGLNYDADGNLLCDGTWNFQYDAENRLISMETVSLLGAVGSGRWKRLDFQYDYLNRRVQKRVRSDSSLVVGQGLKAEYYSYSGVPASPLSGAPILTRYDQQIDFGWGTGTPGGGVPIDNFAVRWTGKVVVPAGGLWTFYTITDDGVRLKINGQALITDDTSHADYEQSASISLAAGTYDIEMTMFDGGGGATARLCWSGPGVTKAIIPRENLVAPAIVNPFQSTDTTIRFIWDSNSLIAELNATNASNVPSVLNVPFRTYSWGLDLLSSLSAAGGVGGLLSVTDGGNVYIPLYDGNGNIHGGIDTSGNIVASIDISISGEVLQSGGSKVLSMPFLFASKYLDLETGYFQYNNRYYDPSLGRFINRDPSGESGGANLYRYCMNCPINKWDYLGMYMPEGRLDDGGGDSTTGYTDGSLNFWNTSITDWVDPEGAAWRARNGTEDVVNIRELIEEIDNKVSEARQKLEESRKAAAAEFSQHVHNAYILRNPSEADLAAAAIYRLQQQQTPQMVAMDRLMSKLGFFTSNSKAALTKGEIANNVPGKSRQPTASEMAVIKAQIAGLNSYTKDKTALILGKELAGRDYRMMTDPADMKTDWAYTLGGNTIYLNPDLLKENWPLKDGAGNWTLNWPLLSTMVHEDIHIRLDPGPNISNEDRVQFIAWQHTWIGSFERMQGKFIGDLYDRLSNYTP